MSARMSDCLYTHRGELRPRPDFWVADDLVLALLVESRRDVVLARVRLGGPVDARQVDVRGVGELGLYTTAATG